MQSLYLTLAINLLNASNFKVKSIMLLVLRIIIFVALTIHACPSPSGGEPERETYDSTSTITTLSTQTKNQIRTTSTTPITINTVSTQTKRPHLDFSEVSFNCFNNYKALYSITVSFILEYF